jgi:hypothetical protein
MPQQRTSTARSPEQTHRFFEVVGQQRGQLWTKRAHERRFESLLRAHLPVDGGPVGGRRQALALGGCAEVHLKRGQLARDSLRFLTREASALARVVRRPLRILELGERDRPVVVAIHDHDPLDRDPAAPDRSPNLR